MPGLPSARAAAALDSQLPLLALVSVRDPLEVRQAVLRASKHSRGGVWQAESSAGLKWVRELRICSATH